jgi:glycosyltransferase involved in cell wall biosynthesis
LEFSKSIGLKNPHLVYQGVDTNFFKPGKRQIKNKEIIISFVGRMIKTKGPQILLNVAKELVQKYPNIKFIFAGSGDFYKQLSAQDEPRINFVGALNRNQVAQLLTNTDIFVLPSSHHEGLPTGILEAGASGCVVVATNKGGIKEVISDNKTGLLIKPTEDSLQGALEKLIKDQSLRIKLSKTLQDKIKKEFDWKIIASQFKMLIKKQLGLSL